MDYIVYVRSKDGKPLMPITRRGKVRHLLRDKAAKIVNYHPFTIQLTTETRHEVDEVTLGIDTGYLHVGLSATTKNHVLYESKNELRNDLVQNIKAKKRARRVRRSRKLRYRKPRFLNRKRSKGWLPPSIKSRLDCHLNLVAKVHKILPISKVVVEVAKFDIQKIKNPDIKGVEYQQGEQFGFWNVREYVLDRDNHTCQCCKGKSGSDILQTHHITPRKDGGSNAPSNLVTLCKPCHDDLHAHNKTLNIEIDNTSYKAETFMSILRKYLVIGLREKYDNVKCTYGYITKYTRIKNHLKKDHNIDARCISGNPLAKPNGEVYIVKKVRCHNRQLHKFKTSKGGKRKINQSPYIVHGYRLFDTVNFNGKICFVYSRRTSGSFLIKDIDGNTISESINYKKLKLVEKRKGWIFDVRKS